MTTTTVLPSVFDETFEEFALACQVVDARVEEHRRLNLKKQLKLTYRGEPCPHPATYYGRFPCCGIVAFACESHAIKGTDMFCVSCNRRIGLVEMKWMLI